MVSGVLGEGVIAYILSIIGQHDMVYDVKHKTLAQRNPSADNFMLRVRAAALGTLPATSAPFQL